VNLIQSPLAVIGLVAGAIAATIIVVYLIRRPPLDRATKLWLLCGVGVFPLVTAFAGNLEGYEATKKRRFCGSCHVMERHVSDSDSMTSLSLASRHARNKLFGDENCYVCHADYGMFGTVLTKLGGMKHVQMYYTEYRTIPLDEALTTIHLYKPYPNRNCMQCHSTELDIWSRVPDHKSSLEDVRSGRVSCASGGCHGYAHPFTKEIRKTHAEIAPSDRLGEGSR
jgi:nitrate/TMAO reductase-like tetraheme cytochrome c subunit